MESYPKVVEGAQNVNACTQYDACADAKALHAEAQGAGDARRKAPVTGKAHAPRKGGASAEGGGRKRRGWEAQAPKVEGVSAEDDGRRKRRWWQAQAPTAERRWWRWCAVRLSHFSAA